MNVELLAVLDRIASGIERQNEMTEEAQAEFRAKARVEYTERQHLLAQHEEDRQATLARVAEQHELLREQAQLRRESHEWRGEEHEIAAAHLGLRAPDVVPEGLRSSKRKDAES